MTIEAAKRKRRTRDEIRAFHEAELKRLKDEEEAEVTELLGSALLSLDGALTRTAGKAIAPLKGWADAIRALILQRAPKK